MGKRVLAAGLVLIVFLLHQDLWWWRTSRPLIFGTLPPALAYHAFYCIMASGLMWVLVRLCWPKELDEQERSERLSKRP